MKHFIYADNAATTKLDKDAFNAMLPWLQEEYGNASQPYSFARKPKKALMEARTLIAECIGAQPDEIYFTSGCFLTPHLLAKAAGEPPILTGWRAVPDPRQPLGHPRSLGSPRM